MLRLHLLGSIPGASQGLIESVFSMASMKEDLKLLTKNGVHADVLAWLANSPQDCTDIKLFANIVDEASQLKNSILQHTSQKDNLGQLARLKQAWKEAESINQTKLKRLGQGLAEDLLDEALDSATRKSKCDIFQNFYQWTLKPRDMVSDTLLGRIVREFEVGQPSMFAVLRTRSLACSQRAPPTKRHRVTEAVQLNIAQPDEEAAYLEDSGKLRTYFSCFRTLATGWAVAGCFDVTFEGKLVKFCHWQDACTYVSNFEAKAWAAADRYPEESVLRYIVDTEEKVRATAIERCRSDSMPWGRALLHAWKEESEVWIDAKDSLSSSGVSSSHKHLPKHDAPAPASTALKVKPATATKLPSGIEIYKRWNDARGCPARKCPKGKAHVCDVLLQTGAVCASASHTRTEHDPTRHGAVAPFMKS